MKLTLAFSLSVFCAFSIAAQSDLDKLVATERAFAQTALDKDTKSAFLEFMANDAVIFVPEKTSAKPYWAARQANASSLRWAPNFGDISSNGLLGYTTGNWEFRAKGKTDEPGAFGNFVTVWLRQPSGQYRWVVDIGVSHDKPEKYSEEFSGPKIPGAGNPRQLSAADTANRFFEMANSVGLQKAYAQFADDDVKFFREGEFPGTGRSNLLSRIKKYRAAVAFPKRSVFFESADIAYVNNSYSFVSDKNVVVEAGNFLQLWKFIGGRWKIVLDIFKPFPAKTT
jgi:ketosteroid isomerase-like protein